MKNLLAKLTLLTLSKVSTWGKTLIFMLVLSLISCAHSHSEDIRKPAVAGAFYPADKAELQKQVDGFLANAKKVDIKGRILAIIAPHAGYDYSGQVAAYSFKQLEGTNFKKIIIISPNRRY